MEITSCKVNKPVLLERNEDGIARLILNDPPLNLMTVYMNECLNRTLDQIAAENKKEVAAPARI